MEKLLGGLLVSLFFLLGTCTPAGAYVVTMGAEGVGWDNAILTARVVYGPPTTLLRFQYRKVGTTTWTNLPSSGWDNWGASWYCRRVSGLENNTWYEFQVQENKDGTIENGGIRTFRTLPNKPYAITLRAAGVDNSSAVLRARIYYAGHDNVSIRFWYRVSGGTTWTSTPSVSGYRGTLYSTLVTGLTENTSYDFRAEITYGTTSENANVESFTTFFSRLGTMAYDGSLGFGSSPSGWHGVRVENIPSGVRGIRLEVFSSAPFPTYLPLRVVRDNGELLYAGNVLCDNGRSKTVSVRFQRSTVAGDNVYVEVYDAYGFGFRTRGTKSTMSFSIGGVRYSYSYLDRTGKNVRYYDRACGVNLLEAYT